MRQGLGLSYYLKLGLQYFGLINSYGLDGMQL